MVVHAVIALATVAAVAFVFDSAGVTVGPVAPTTWGFLWRAALTGLLLTGLPATLTGVLERGHMYVNWHPSHRAKLLLSLAILVMTAAELATAAGTRGPAVLGSWLGVAVVAGNPAVCLGLSFYGLRITLGRQAIASTSYIPDMHREPPVDILVATAARVAERAKVLEVMEESSS